MKSYLWNSVPCNSAHFSSVEKHCEKWLILIFHTLSNPLAFHIPIHNTVLGTGLGTGSAQQTTTSLTAFLNHYLAGDKSHQTISSETNGDDSKGVSMTSSSERMEGSQDHGPFKEVVQPTAGLRLKAAVTAVPVPGSQERWGHKVLCHPKNWTIYWYIYWIYIYDQYSAL